MPQKSAKAQCDHCQADGLVRGGQITAVAPHPVVPSRDRQCQHKACQKSSVSFHLASLLPFPFLPLRYCHLVAAVIIFIFCVAFDAPVRVPRTGDPYLFHLLRGK